MWFLEIGNGDLSGLLILIALVMIGPAVLFFIIAVILMLKDKKKVAKIFWILGVLYLIISFGTCFSMT